MKRLLPLFFLALSAYPATAQQSDVETRAMKDEMQRSIGQLHLESVAAPYFISYRIVDMKRTEAQASFGALTSSAETQSRTLTVTVRVGDYQFDNSNGAVAGGSAALLLGSLIGGAVQLPQDDNYEELRRKIWIATDTAYKRAAEQLSAKKAAQATRNRDEALPDFTRQPARQESEILPPVNAKLSDAEHLVRATSAVFTRVPSAQSSEARFVAVNLSEHFLDSEGTAYTRQIPEVSFYATATMQNGSGEFFDDNCHAYGRSLAEIPNETELVAKTQAVADALTARRKGRTAKRYNGPVLVEGDAAAELFANDFASLLAAHPHPAATGNNALAALLTGSTASLINKIGSRVLPEFLTVTDNPRQTTEDGHPLLGHYQFDEEGVPSQETTLVKDGMLKTLLSSRTPARASFVSTGSMREHGVSPGNLLVAASKTSSEAELKAQLVELVKTRNLEYGYIVRRLSNHRAVEAVRIFPDGKEELVRDARLAEINANTFKDILAVSKERTVYTATHSGGALQGIATLGADDLVTYVVPAMLFEDMTVEHVPNDSPKLPVVPSPFAEK